MATNKQVLTNSLFHDYKNYHYEGIRLSVDELFVLKSYLKPEQFNIVNNLNLIDLLNKINKYDNLTDKGWLEIYYIVENRLKKSNIEKLSSIELEERQAKFKEIAAKEYNDYNVKMKENKAKQQELNERLKRESDAREKINATKKEVSTKWDKLNEEQLLNQKYMIVVGIILIILLILSITLAIKIHPACLTILILIPFGLYYINKTRTLNNTKYKEMNVLLTQKNKLSEELKVFKF